MSNEPLGQHTLSTPSTLRLAQTGGALSALDGLSGGLRDLSALLADLERDVERLRQRRKHTVEQGTIAARLRRDRVEQEVQVLASQATQLRDALRSLRSEAQTLGEEALPATQAAQFDEQLRGEEEACTAALEDVLALSHEQIDIKRAAVANAPGMGKKDVLVSGDIGPQAGTPSTFDTLPEGNVARIEPPEELREGLADTARELRSLAYSSRPLKLENINGQKPTDSRVANLQSRWASWNERTKAPQLMDPNEMTQWILRQAYVDNSADMRSFAIKIQFSTTLKGVLRDELNRAREARSKLHKGNSKDKALSAPFLRKKVRQDPIVDADGNYQVRPVEDDGEIVDIDQLNDYIRDMETALSTSSDDMQLSQLELQAMTQRQQQTLNALSNLSKTLHETSMAILRKIGN